MKLASNVFRRLAMVMLFASIGTMMASSLPNVYADMSPSLAQDPNVPVVGGTMMVVVNAGQANTLPHVQGVVRVYEPNLTVGTGSGVFSVSACDFGVTGGTGVGTSKIWEFRKLSDLSSPNRYTMTLTTDSLKIPFGFGSASITPTKTPGVSLDEAQGKWVQTSESPNPGTTDGNIDLQTIVGKPYRTATCGFDSGGSSGNENQYDVQDPFSTQPLVAGTVIPIDATALLIGGLISSPLMILPVLGIGAVASFALLKFQVQRKQ